MRLGMRRLGTAAAIAGLLGAATPTFAQTRAPSPALRPIAPEQAGFDAARLAKLNAAMKAVVDQGRVAGILTVLGRHGRIVDTQVYGRPSLAAPTPLKEDAIFRIYSMTKPITGVAMMMLFEEGKWKLDDPVSKYVPEFAKLRAVKSVGADGTPVAG